MMGALDVTECEVGHIHSTILSSGSSYISGSKHQELSQGSENSVTSVNAEGKDMKPGAEPSVIILGPRASFSRQLLYD